MGERGQRIEVLVTSLLSVPPCRPRYRPLSADTDVHTEQRPFETTRLVYSFHKIVFYRPGKPTLCRD